MVGGHPSERVTFAHHGGRRDLLPQEFKQRRVRPGCRTSAGSSATICTGIDYETSLHLGPDHDLAARRRLKLPYHDSLVAATAKRHDLTVMTRNVGYFAPFSVEVFNPWGDRRKATMILARSRRIQTIQPGSTSANFLIAGGGEGRCLARVVSGL